MLWEGKKLDFLIDNQKETIKNRVKRLLKLRENPEVFSVLKKYYSTRPVDFIIDHMITYDPRQMIMPYLPFTLFPKQRELIEWIDKRVENREDGVIEKTRDFGVSYIAIAYSVWALIFKPGIKIGFGSRKEKLVDEIGNPDSLFEKARIIIEYLPRELRPNVQVSHMKIINIDTGATMTGEAGDNVGRGGRNTIYFKDEAQPLYSGILTPEGWRSMRDVSVGDIVIGSNGGGTKIIGVNNCGSHQIYRFRFSDGSEVDCSENHLWEVNRVMGLRKTLVISAKSIYETYKYISPSKQIAYRYRVPQVPPIRFSKRVLPIDPYVIGAILGDGSITNTQSSITFTSDDIDVINLIAKKLPEGVEIKKCSGSDEYGYRFVTGHGKGKGKRGRKHILISALKDLGIYGNRSYEKSIPEDYLFSDINDRLSLLQGLMDTDGSGSGGVASFHSSSPELAKGVRYLAQSLGGCATLNVKQDHRGYRDMYVIHIALPDGMQPFQLDRKLKRLRVRKHPVTRTIISVEKKGFEDVKCITVDNKDGLYVTDDCILTHNSAFYERPQKIEAALSMNSEVKIDISTPCGVGNPFYQKRMSGNYPVFICDWRDDPRKDQAWYDKQIELLDPWIVAQEIDRDYYASVEGLCIPAKYVQAAINFPLKAEGLRVAGFDVADEGADANALCLRHGPVVKSIESWKVGTTTESTRKVYSICKENVINKLYYESNGVGAGVKGEIKSILETDKSGFDIDVSGINPGSNHLPGEWADGKTNADMFANLRAKLWWSARRRFKRTYQKKMGLHDWPDESCISIPNDNQLIMELSQPGITQNEAGKLLMESKAKIKSRGVKSGNKADSLILTEFIPEISRTDVFSVNFA